MKAAVWFEKGKSMTSDELLIEAKKLRSEAEAAEVAFYLFLVRVEREHIQAILDVGCTTFEQWIETHALARPSRYRAFQLGAAQCGESVAAELGVDATIARRTVTPERRGEFDKAIRDYRQVHGGPAPKRDTAMHIAKQISPREEVPRASRIVSETDRLRAENEQLKADLKAARARIETLEAELARAQTPAATAAATGRKPKETRKRAA